MNEKPMNRKIFMERLRELLKDIPAEEREEALTYYESYFDEAGAENEEKVIRELESPQKVAETIKKDLLGTMPAVVQEVNRTEEGQQSQNSYEKNDYNRKERQAAGNHTDHRSRNILLVLLIILTFPLWIGIAAVLFGVAVAIVGVLFGLIVALVASTGAVFLSGIVLVCVGIGGCISGEVAVGLLLMGVGCILTAVGLLLFIAAVWVCGKGIPAICRGCSKIFHNLFHRRKEGVQ